MLVLSRRENESVLINGGEITVRLIKIDKGKALIGFQAPRHVSIVRHELPLINKKISEKSFSP